MNYNDELELNQRRNRKLIFMVLSLAAAAVSAMRPVQVVSWALINPAPNSSVDAPLQHLEGTGEPYRYVRVFANNLELGKTQVRADGTWTVAYPLTPDRYNVLLEVLDSKDVQIGKYGPYEINVSWDPDTAPVVSSPSEGDILTSGFAVTVAGQCAPRTQIEILLNDRRVTKLAATQTGEWKTQVVVTPGTTRVTVRLQNNPRIATSIRVKTK